MLFIEKLEMQELDDEVRGFHLEGLRNYWRKNVLLPKQMIERF